MGQPEPFPGIRAALACSFVLELVPQVTLCCHFPGWGPTVSSSTWLLKSTHHWLTPQSHLIPREALFYLDVSSFLSFSFNASQNHLHAVHQTTVRLFDSWGFEREYSNGMEASHGVPEGASDLAGGNVSQRNIHQTFLCLSTWFYNVHIQPDSTRRGQSFECIDKRPKKELAELMVFT